MNPPKGPTRLPWQETPLQYAQRRAREMEAKQACISFEKEKRPMAQDVQSSSKSTKPWQKPDYTLLKYGEPALKPACEFRLRKRSMFYAKKNGPEQLPPHEWDKWQISQESEAESKNEADPEVKDPATEKPNPTPVKAEEPTGDDLKSDEPEGPPIHNPLCTDLFCPGGKACQPPLSHHADCTTVACPGGKICYDRHDPVQIAAACSFLEEMQFCPRSEEVVRGVKDIPHSINAIRKEKKMAFLVHATLQSRGALTIEELWNTIPIVAAEQDFKNRFESEGIDVLRSFVESRNYLFERTPHADLVRNRGYGYRSGIIKIASFIRENAFYKNGCKVLDLWRRCVVRDLYPYDPREHTGGVRVTDYHFTLEQMTKSSELIELLEREHPHIFKFTDTDDIQKAYVDLTDEAFGLTSLWWTETLPVPLLREESDRSRTFHFMAKVFDNTHMGGKAYILHGPFHLRIIALSWVELKEANPQFYKGQLLNVVAFLNLSSEYDFTAVKYCTLETAENHKLLRAMHDFDTPYEHRAIATETPQPPLPRPPSLNPGQKAKVRFMLREESKRIEFVDRILLEAMTVEDFETAFNKTEERSGFGSFAAVVAFIQARPHLYDYEISGTVTIVKQVFYKERLVLRYLLDLMSHFPFGIRRHELKYRLKVGQGGRALAVAAFYSYLIGKLDRIAMLLIEDEDPKDLDFDLLRLKGSYVVDAKVVLPYYAIGHIHRFEDVNNEVEEEAPAAEGVV